MKLQKQSEMQDFFDALGIDENIFEQMAETFTSNFMIEGKIDNGSERDAKPGAGISAGCNSGNLGGGRLLNCGQKKKSMCRS